MVELGVLVVCLIVVIASYRQMIGRYCQHVSWSAMEKRCMTCGISARELSSAIHTGLDTHPYPKGRHVFRDSPWREISPWVRYLAVPLPETSPYLFWEIEELDNNAPSEIRQKFERLIAMRRPLKGKK